MAGNLASLRPFLAGSAFEAERDERTAAEHAKIAWESFSNSTEGSLTYRLGHNQGVSSLLLLAWSQWGLGHPSSAKTKPK